MLEDVSKVAQRIENGERLVLAGEERLLTQLPRGTWIGGTIPYFMAERGVVSRDKVHVTPLMGNPLEVWTKSYDADQLADITKDAPENGYTILIIPFGSPAHYRFAHEAPEYPETFLKPVLGWISGVHLTEIGEKVPHVFEGMHAEPSAGSAVALHARLPENVQAMVGTVNIFRQGAGDELTFDEEGFEVDRVLVNGQSRVFSEYLTEQDADLRWPLVADYYGTKVNVSFQAVDSQSKRVKLYAPVFRHVKYRLAAPLIEGYEQVYANAVRGRECDIAFSCILNFLYGELEGKPVTGARGIVTFGEIAHQLLNQTTVYLEVVKI